MIEKSLKSAVGTSIGVALGGCILPRFFFRNLYNNTFPPIWKQAILYLIVGYMTSFLVFFIINWVKAKLQK
ncbi:hypothetical protein [Cellulosilyticum sp. I15G10I2]|uniref:hypothetical protein n=1 Tax=Cellulosilyticum sp. I15G10I2 TaxID=1892843 RepID=UPI00085C8D3C|nr:hypothetical protein [Cellulosilyticum sp. I15G10I2]